MFPIKRTVFFTNVTVHKNTECLIGNKEYQGQSHEGWRQRMTKAENNRPIPKIFSNWPSAWAAKVFGLLIGC